MRIEEILLCMVGGFVWATLWEAALMGQTPTVASFLIFWFSVFVMGYNMALLGKLLWPDQDRS